MTPFLRHIEIDNIVTVTTFASMKIQIREAKAKLSKFGDLAHKGQRVVVSKNGVPWFDLVPHEKPKRNLHALNGIKGTLSAKEAIAPVDSRDLAGWI